MNNSKKVNGKCSKKDYQKSSKKVYSRSDRAITLIALIVTTIFCYDEFIKSSNNNGFLLQTIQSKS